jgi:hypothetical protein
MSERQLHQYVIDLLRLRARRDVLYLHIPNESPRSPRYGAQLVRMGMLPGAADLLVVVNGIAHWLELKVGRGRQSPAQVAFEAAAWAAGATYAIARTPEQARATLSSWGALRPDSVGEIVKHMLSA